MEIIDQAATKPVKPQQVAAPQFTPYEAYQDSGVEWLGEIPVGWGVKRLKFFVKINKGLMPKKLVSVNDKNFPPYLSMDYLRTGISKVWVDDPRAKVVLKDEIILLWDGANAGEFLKSKYGVLSSTAAHITYSSMCKSFAWQASLLIERALRHSTVGMGIPHVNGYELRNFIHPLPPLPQQKTIATYLDQKTKQLDHAIALKQKQIKLLKEYQEIMIANAVTKGLDPDAPMQDSGVAWLGEIPVGWGVKRLKHVAFINPSNNYAGEDLTGLLCFLPMEKVNADGSIVCDSYLPFKKYGNGFTVFKKNDVILAKITPCFENGKSAYLDKLPTAFGYGSTEFHVIRDSYKCLGKYIYYIVNSPVFIDRGTNNMVGSAGHKRVTNNFLSNYSLALPPLPEQKAIATYLDQKTTEIKKAINLHTEQIAKLKEYKTVLINNAVTGKIKITPSML